MGGPKFGTGGPVVFTIASDDLSINVGAIVPPYGRFQPTFYGMFEDNDPAKRLLMIINRDNDLAEYWEFSDEGYFPIDLSNEAYKLGVNYLIYALSR